MKRKNLYEINRQDTSIIAIEGLEVLDSRGFPTLAVMITLANGARGKALVPSGASTGKHEAIERRDGDKKRYLGKGVADAVAAIRGEVCDLLLGQDATEQRRLDNLLLELDGSVNKSILGANTILATSLAIAKAAANGLGCPLYRYLGGVSAHVLPVPMMNIINGGLHADNGIDIQEFMIMPLGFTQFSEALRAGVEIYHALKKLLKQKGFSSNVGDEGGFAPALNSVEQALELIMAASLDAGYQLQKHIMLALDCAASEFFVEGKYQLAGQSLTSEKIVSYYQKLCNNFPIFSIEDGMAEDDEKGWTMLTEILGKKIQLVGDDLFTTNPSRITKGIEAGIANSLLVKVNQIGSLTETLKAVELAKTYAYSIVMSHRSGETEDTTIADLAVATNAGQIKTGAPARSERTAKYNRLLAIEYELAGQAEYAGKQIIKNIKGNIKA